MGLGYFFSEAITSLALSAARLGRMLGIVAVAGGYILVKYLRRRLFLQRLRMGEIEADPAPPNGSPELALGDRHDGPPSSSAPDLVSSVCPGGSAEAICEGNVAVVKSCRAG
jgi:hypothetical protein